MRMYLHVSGRVQGVGFRYATKQKANDFELAGWVRNLEDGTVELEVEGKQESIQRFIDTLKEGFHPFIRVDHINMETLEKSKGYNGFKIK
ncbi:acylphosphatase [Ornithinibacillus xuwenensis]|jgi:acylphosphatase|uniref:Acylphosphatase n=1 Tax=Ornithinibacillus xuwenensis TaxID=3144668 RepID=A0ABU9XDA0_9BACI